MPVDPMTNQRLDMPFGRTKAAHEQGELRHPMRYPSPFFDISKFYMPQTVKELFKWCKYFYKTNGLITSVVYKLSEYPVTELNYNTPEDVEEVGPKKIKDLLKNQFRINDFLIEVGLDYFVYGNCLVGIYFPFKRLFKCPKCNTKNQREDFTEFGKKGDLKYKKHKFEGECPNCGQHTKFKIEDKAIKRKKKINLIRYNPENFDVEHNEITGDTSYYYAVPSKIKKKVLRKDERTLMTLPKKFLESIEKGKKVRMNEEKLYHFKRADVADNDMGWGMPLILPVLNKMFHIQVLLKAQQTIAMEHLVPLRVLFPADNQSDAAPHQHTGLGMWKNRVETEIRKWKQDPNYMPVMPIPLGSTTVSGDGKMLLLTQEMRMIEEEIINGLGVPQEFIMGGLSWSGSSISLRILENHFLVYRNQLEEFLNKFLVKQLSNFLDVKPIEVKFTEFKMADDVQKMQLMQQLNDAHKISDEKFLKEVANVDWKQQLSQILEEYESKQDLFEKIGEEQGTIQGIMQGKVTQEQMKAQQQGVEQKSNQKPPDAEGYWQELLQMIEQKKMMEEQEMQMDPEQMATEYAHQLLNMEEEERVQMMQQMQQENPQLFQLVVQKAQELEQQAGEPQPQEPQREPVEEPMPERRPPRREGGGGMMPG